MKVHGGSYRLSDSPVSCRLMECAVCYHKWKEKGNTMMLCSECGSDDSWIEAKWVEWKGSLGVWGEEVACKVMRCRDCGRSHLEYGHILRCPHCKSDSYAAEIVDLDAVLAILEEEALQDE